MNNQQQKEQLMTSELWGLPLKAVHGLANEYRYFWERFRGGEKTSTRDTSKYAYNYLKANYVWKPIAHTEISRETFMRSQNLQHFMSNSPWQVQPIYQQIQEDIKQIPALQTGGALILDVRSDEKAGDKSAGAGCQYNGRFGKVDMSQVGVFLAYTNLTMPQFMWTWVEGDLFLPEVWFFENM